MMVLQVHCRIRKLVYAFRWKIKFLRSLFDGRVYFEKYIYFLIN